MKTNLFIISNYLTSNKPCGNLMLSKSIVSALDHLSVTYHVLPRSRNPLCHIHSIVDIIHVNILWFASNLLRLKFSKSLAYRLKLISNKPSESPLYLYDGYDYILNALITPQNSNYLVSSDLYSRAAWNAFCIHDQPLALKSFRLLYYLRSIIIENLIYPSCFSKVFFVSALDVYLYQRRNITQSQSNGLRVPFSLDTTVTGRPSRVSEERTSGDIRVLFTGNFDQTTHVDYLLECFRSFPYDPSNILITVQSPAQSDYFLKFFPNSYPFITLIGKVPSLDDFYANFDFIVFTNKLTTGIQTKYLHAFKSGSIVVAPSSTASDFGSNLIHEKNILLYDSYDQIYDMILNTFRNQSAFYSLQEQSLSFYHEYHSFRHTLAFVENIFFEL